MSPLKGLSNLAARLGSGGIWIKDESARLDLQSFKVLGGSYAIYKLIQKRLGREDQELSFADLTNGTIQKKLGDITFAAATDGNHGRGVAWSASQMGFKSVIYVHKLTSQGRIQAIEKSGARAVVVDGNYNDAVSQVDQDAQRNGWEVVSDTSWEGYEDIPKCFWACFLVTSTARTQVHSRISHSFFDERNSPCVSPHRLAHCQQALVRKPTIFAAMTTTVTRNIAAGNSENIGY